MHKHLKDISTHLRYPEDLESNNLVTLRTFACEMSEKNGLPIYENWLVIMRAFWRGDLFADGLTSYLPEWRSQLLNFRGGSEFSHYTREQLLELALKVDLEGTQNHGRSLVEKIETISRWKIRDYKNIRGSGSHRFSIEVNGPALCARRSDFELWRAGHNAIKGKVPRSLNQAIRYLSRAEMIDWFKTRVSTWPVDLAPPSGASDLSALERHFPGTKIQRQDFSEARRVTPLQWRKQGRRSPTVR